MGAAQSHTGILFFSGLSSTFVLPAVRAAAARALDPLEAVVSQLQATLQPILLPFKASLAPEVQTFVDGRPKEIAARMETSIVRALLPRLLNLVGPVGTLMQFARTVGTLAGEWNRSTYVAELVVHLPYLSVSLSRLSLMMRVCCHRCWWCVPLRCCG
jgi:hypothetical protein